MTIINKAYGLTCYLLGILSLLLFIAFAANLFGALGLTSIQSLDIDQLNSAPADNPLLVDIGLLALFGLQHTIMARPGFKAIWTKLVPAHLERSTYVLLSAVVLYILVVNWQPVAGSVWHLENSAARWVLHILYAAGWIISFQASQQINPSYLMGLRQSFSGDAVDHRKQFKTPVFYQYVRHPIQAGVVLSLVATPDMTVGRFVLAAGMIVYVIIALKFEERDLIAEFGDTYRDYKKRVPALIPWKGRMA
ncbi:methyltransferase family protein [Kordiimonas marina]|uniref:methyltransferase family protein n=1 Tax=Kordiimonas marina TaxID=2872312 RepID=UPI001FF48185|nr:isoprenylcysteine carboxylmethyltransferase family protein [Kordiimonas marina]MCJ9427556.1 isoprenylcysteine carboxylmethyltransferase family protein [Kordiimonas marina]